jgi:ligand-binding sensor domain-containing protein
MSRRKRLAAAAGVSVVAAIAFGGWSIWRASRELNEAGEQVASGSLFHFTARPISPVIPAGFESISSPAIFSDAAFFHDHLFIAGPAAIDEYDSAGALLGHYRIGIELPPAPAVALAVGFAGDSNTQELWVATSGEGLAAFDGRGWRHIAAEDPRGRKLTALLTTPNGRILLGTEKAGVLVYNGRELKRFHPSLADLHVTALTGDDADLWVGTIDRGALHYKAGAAEAIDALPDRQVLSLARAGEVTYVGTAMGIAEVRENKVARVLAPGYFAQALAAANGKLWMGTLEEGMFQVPLEARPGRGSGLGSSAVCGTCSIRRILPTETGVLTLAEDALWRGDQAILTRGSGALLADRNVASLAVDGTGRLWIGYFDRGLEILGSGGGHYEDDHLFCINRIVHDSVRGVSAVATANGLVLFDATTSRRRVLTHEDGLIANQITDVALRTDGSMVAATPAGVSFIDGSGISSVYAFHGLVNNHAYALASDGPRTLVGTLGGLSVLDGGLVKASYTTSNSALKHNWITAIRPVGNEWFVGTYGAGVLRLDAAGRWQTFDDLRGGLEVNPNAMASTPAAVYAGTLGRGLAVYNRDSGRWNFWSAGLPSRNVTAVEARGGVVYIGTDNGLVKIAESTVVGR